MKKAPVKNFIRRFTASYLAVFLLIGHVPAGSAAETLPQSGTFSLLDTSSFSIPAHLGRVLKTHPGRNGGVLIFIQDAHSVPSAQENISGLTAHLSKTYGLKTIYLEGAEGPLEPLFLRAFPDKEVLKSVLAGYAGQGVLAGGVLSALTGDETLSHEGIEDWQLYEEGIAHFLAAERNLDKIAAELSALDRELSRKKEAVYPEALKKADKEIEDFYEGNGSLIDLLKTLSALEPPEKDSELAVLMSAVQAEDSDGAAVERELKELHQSLLSRAGKLPADEESKAAMLEINKKFQAFSTSSLSAPAFAAALDHAARRFGIDLEFSRRLSLVLERELKVNEIQGTELFSSLERYASAVKASFAVSGEMKDLDAETVLLRRLRKFAKLEIGFEDWNAISALQKGESPVPAAQWFLKEAGNLWASHIAFYENTFKRDDVMWARIRNGLAAGPDARPQALIAGGFHTQGLTARAEKDGVPYAVIQPFIEKLPELPLYKQHMAGNVPWRKYFGGAGKTVNLYEAFLRTVRDGLLNASGAEKGALLKSWRDEIIRSLAARGRVEEAGDFTRFIDEAGGEKEPENLEAEWLANVERFRTGIMELSQRGALTEQNLLQFARASNTPSPGAGHAVLAVRSELRSDLVPDSQEGEFFDTFASSLSPEDITAFELAAPVQAGDISQVKVLVLEDNENQSDSVRDLLIAEGAREENIVTVKGTRAFLQNLKTDYFHIVVLDNSVIGTTPDNPLSSGLGVINALRARGIQIGKNTAGPQIIYNSAEEREAAQAVTAHLPPEGAKMSSAILKYVLRVILGRILQTEEAAVPSEAAVRPAPESLQAALDSFIPAEKTTASKISDLNVLIVEDSAEAIEEIKAAFMAKGVDESHITVANNSHSFLAAMRQKYFHVVVADYNLADTAPENPLTSGLGIVEALRERGAAIGKDSGGPVLIYNSSMEQARAGEAADYMPPGEDKMPPGALRNILPLAVIRAVTRSLPEETKPLVMNLESLVQDIIYPALFQPAAPKTVVMVRDGKVIDYRSPDATAETPVPAISREIFYDIELEIDVLNGAFLLHAYPANEKGQRRSETPENPKRTYSFKFLGETGDLRLIIPGRELRKEIAHLENIRAEIGPLPEILAALSDAAKLDISLSTPVVDSETLVYLAETFRTINGIDPEQRRELIDILSSYRSVPSLMPDNIRERLLELIVDIYLSAQTRTGEIMEFFPAEAVVNSPLGRLHSYFGRNTLVEAYRIPPAKEGEKGRPQIWMSTERHEIKKRELGRITHDIRHFLNQMSLQRDLFNMILGQDAPELVQLIPPVMPFVELLNDAANRYSVGAVLRAFQRIYDAYSEPLVSRLRTDLINTARQIGDEELVDDIEKYIKQAHNIRKNAAGPLGIQDERPSFTNVNELLDIFISPNGATQRVTGWNNDDVIKERLKATENYDIFTLEHVLYGVLMNLINNAIQEVTDNGTNYAKGENKVQISTLIGTAADSWGTKWKDADNTGYFFIKIRDEGRGFPEEKKLSVNEGFGLTTTKEGGTGAGLKNVAAAVRGPLQGDFELISQTGEGSFSEFIIRLPRRLDTEDEQDRSELREPELQGRAQIDAGLQALLESARPHVDAFFASTYIVERAGAWSQMRESFNAWTAALETRDFPTIYAAVRQLEKLIEGAVEILLRDPNLSKHPAKDGMDFALRNLRNLAYQHDPRIFFPPALHFSAAPAASSTSGVGLKINIVLNSMDPFRDSKVFGFDLRTSDEVFRAELQALADAINNEISRQGIKDSSASVPDAYVLELNFPRSRTWRMAPARYLDFIESEDTVTVRIKFDERVDLIAPAVLSHIDTILSSSFVLPLDPSEEPESASLAAPDSAERSELRREAEGLIVDLHPERIRMLDTRRLSSVVRVIASFGAAQFDQALARAASKTVKARNYIVFDPDDEKPVSLPEGFFEEQSSALRQTLYAGTEKQALLEQTFTIAVVLPQEGASYDDSSFAANFVKSIGDDPSVKNVIVVGKVRGALMRTLKDLSKRLLRPGGRRVNITDQAAVPAAYVEGAAAVNIQDLLPFRVDMTGVKNPLVRDYAEQVQLVAAAHAAKLIAAQPDLLKDPIRLQAELLKKLSLFEGYNQMITFHQNGFTISGAEALIFLRHQAELALARSA